MESRNAEVTRVPTTEIAIGDRKSESVGSGGDLKQITLKNGYLSATVLPQLGGKIASLIRLSSGREFLLQPSHNQLNQVPPGAEFHEYDTSGFDDCFPTVAACQYPDAPFRGVELPDHGEIWTADSIFDVRNNELFLELTGKRLPYIFRKRIALDGEALALKYQLDNVGEESFSYLWSAHPLLSVEQGSRLLLPSEVRELIIESSVNAGFHEGAGTCAWPIATLASGHNVDLSRVGRPENGRANKFFTNRLSEGCCAVYFPASDESISFRFDVEDVPYLGVWICEGGWPDRERAQYTVALEPCTGSADSLAEAMRRSECSTIQPGETKRWELRILVQSGVPHPLVERLIP